MRKKKIGGSIYFLIAINVLILVGCVAWSWSLTWWAYVFFVLPVTVYGIVRTLRQRIREADSGDDHSVNTWDNTPFRCVHGYKLGRDARCRWPEGHDLRSHPFEPSEQERATKLRLPTPQ